MIPKTRQPSNREHAVVCFRRRHTKTVESAKSRGPVQKHKPNIVLLLSFAEYERDEVDYHHRLIVNGLAFAVTVALMATGVWLASNLHE